MLRRDKAPPRHLRGLARWLSALPGLLALLAGVLFGPVHAADDISPAEQAVFLADHLKGLPPAAKLHYDYRAQEGATPEVRDAVTIELSEGGEEGWHTRAEFLHEERSLTLPEMDKATANPVILYFLEHDVRGMKKRLGGAEGYFRKRIRMALAMSAVVSPVEIEYGGRKLAATRVVIDPYVDDPLKDRLKGMVQKRYVFTLCDAVPGGVFELRTVVEGGPQPEVPHIEETLTLRPTAG